MAKDFVFVDTDMTIAEAQEYLDDSGLDAIPVLNPDRTVFGLLTQKNLAGFHRRPLNNPHAFHAWEICDARPLATASITPVEDVIEKLLATNCSQVLVVDENRHLLGVISAERLLAHALPGTQAVANRHSRH